MTIQSISPVKKGANWVFTDESTGLVDELLVSGADKLCDAICEEFHIIPELGFTVHFTNDEISMGSSACGCLQYVCQSDGGSTYEFNDKAVWLCANLLRYFDSPPKMIYWMVEESQAMLAADMVANVNGFKLIYCQNHDLILPAVDTFWLDALKPICEKAQNIDWINLHLIRQD